MKYITQVVLAVVLGAGMLGYAETPKAATKEVPLTDQEKLQIENLSLKKSLLEQAQNALVQQICNRAGIEVKGCSIDQSRGVVTQMQEQKPEKK